MNAPTGPIENGLPPSRWADIDGPVHYVDYGGPDGSPLLVLVHGLGGSLLSWAAVAPALARQNRVIALDLAGFGRTPGSPRPVTLSANQALLHRFLCEVAGTPAILVGHSMGGTIAAMQATQHAQSMAGLVLINPAMPWRIDGRLNPRLASVAAGMAVLASRKGPAPVRGLADAFEQILKDVLRDSYERIPEATIRTIEQNLAAVRLRMAERNASSDMWAAGRSLALTVARKSQFAAMLDAVQGPVLLLHGDQDRLVPVSAAWAVARTQPSWTVEIANGIGHVPQLEAPDWTFDHITTWLQGRGAVAAQSACGASVRLRRANEQTPGGTR